MRSLSRLPVLAMSVSGALALAFSGGFVFGVLREIQGARSRIRVHVPPGVEAPAADLKQAQLPPGPALARRWRVVETAVADDPIQSSAVLQDLATGALSTFRVGDRLDNERVLGVERMQVVIRSPNGIAVLDASQDPMPRQLVDPDRLAPFGRCTQDTAEADPQPAPLVFRVPKWLVGHLSQVSALNDLGMQARIVPSFHPSGFKLFAIRPGSVYSLFGFRNGDVIRRINGQEIDSPDKALEVYAKLKEATSVDLEIERDGVPIRHRYVLEQEHVKKLLPPSPLSTPWRGGPTWLVDVPLRR